MSESLDNFAAREKHIALVHKYIRLGDTITHTRCMGCIEEHIYTGHDGIAFCGRPTKDTIRIEKIDPTFVSDVNDIHPANITHINRTPIDVLEFAINFADRR